MNELVPGLWHWTAPHDHINSEVSSYYLAAERVIIDPMLPPGGLAWFEQHGAPEHALLSNRHHDRQAWRLHETFGATVHCIRNGVYELDGRGPVEPFDFGDELPGGVVVHEVDVDLPRRDGAAHPRPPSAGVRRRRRQRLGRRRAGIRPRLSDGRSRADQARACATPTAACSSSTSTRSCWPTARRSPPAARTRCDGSSTIAVELRHTI